MKRESAEFYRVNLRRKRKAFMILRREASVKVLMGRSEEQRGRERDEVGRGGGSEEGREGREGRDGREGGVTVGGGKSGE